MTRHRIGTLVRTAYGEIHVRVDGPDHAPAVVLLHGFGGSMHWWDRVTVQLADRFRVVRVDLIGHGSSAAAAAGCRPNDHARAVVEVLDHLGVNRATVAGHSMGATVAIAVAEASDSVTRLVLIGEGPDASTFSLPKVTKLLRVPVLGHALRRFAPAPIVRLGYTTTAFAAGFRYETAFDDHDQLLKDDRAVAFTTFRHCQLGKEAYARARPLDQRLRDLALPVLVIFGAQDRMWNPRTSTARYGEVPGARIEVIGRAGHSPQIETPQEVAHLIGEYAIADT